MIKLLINWLGSPLEVVMPIFKQRLGITELEGRYVAGSFFSLLPNDLIAGSSPSSPADRYLFARL